MMTPMSAALNNVWEGIANDILPNEDENEDMTGDAVASITADYVETYLQEPQLTEWKAADWDQRDAWLAEAFPKHQLYGF